MTAPDDDLQKRVENLEHELHELEQHDRELHHELRSRAQRKSVRARSERTLWGLPLYDIAIGPNFENGERRGHAKGIVAIGDIATGVVAVGGIAQGGIAVGGLAWGLLSVGGCAFGLLGVLGGVAIGGFALGGVAIGLKAIGGAAVDLGWSVPQGTSLASLIK